MIQSFLKWLRKVVLKEKTKPCQGAKNVKFEKKEPQAPWFVSSLSQCTAFPLWVRT